MVKEFVSRENIVELVNALDNKNNPNYITVFLTGTTPSFNMSKEVANIFHYEMKMHQCKKLTSCRKETLHLTIIKKSLRVHDLLATWIRETV